MLAMGTRGGVAYLDFWGIFKIQNPLKIAKIVEKSFWKFFGNRIEHIKRLEKNCVKKIKIAIYKIQFRGGCVTRFYRILPKLYFTKDNVIHKGTYKTKIFSWNLKVVQRSIKMVLKHVKWCIWKLTSETINQKLFSRFFPNSLCNGKPFEDDSWYFEEVASSGLPKSLKARQYFW